MSSRTESAFRPEKNDAQAAREERAEAEGQQKVPKLGRAVEDETPWPSEQCTTPDPSRSDSTNMVAIFNTI